MRIRVALFAGSPVYYQAPLYRRLAADPRLDFTAIFASDEGAVRPFENEFAQPVDWGVDPLGGYRAVFLRKAGTNPSGGGVFALCDLDVIHQVRRGGYDVLWLHGYHTATHVLAALAQRTRHGAVLYREDQTLLSPRPRWKTAVKSGGLRVLFSGAQALYVGSENRKWFARWGVPDGRLWHVPYAVDNQALQEAAARLLPHRAELKREFGLPVELPVILMVGRLIDKKQPMRVLETFAALREKTPCALLVVGTGNLEVPMRELVARLGIPDVVFARFLDQTEIVRAYAAADVFTLFSSHNETWGLVVNEAMNFGLPLVLSDRVGAASDLVNSGHNGFVVPYDDLDALCAALEQLVRSPSQRSRFGDASLEIVSEYTYDRAAEALVAAVASAVGPRRWARATPRAAPSAGAR